MNFLADTWYLFAVALVSGVLLMWPSLRRGGAAGGLTTAEAIHLINREKAVIVDVRDPTEYAAGHVSNAKNIPLATIEGSTGLPKNKALPLVVVCHRGAQAAKAVGILKKLGHENARPLTGGLAAWREANLPVERSA